MPWRSWSSTGMSGSKAASPIARDIMRKALELDPGAGPRAVADAS